MKTLHRRNFLKLIGLTSAAALVPSALRNAFGAPKAAAKPAAAKKIEMPAGSKAIDPTNDAIAKAIGYQAEISKVDYVKYPKRKLPAAKDQFCKNCTLYSASNEGWGKCTMLSAGLVAADGWCGSWNGPKKV